MRSHLPQSAFGMILLTGLIAGALDGLAAVVDVYLSTGRGPTVVFQYIASAVVGAEAFSGGSSMVVLGLVFHLIIATGWTTLYFAAYPRFRFLRANKIVAGILYGLFVWLMMSQVVIPLTQLSPRPFDFLHALKAIAILMAMIGIPISLLTADFYSRKGKV